MNRTGLGIAAASCLLASLVLGVVALNVSWSSTDLGSAFGFEGDAFYEPFEGGFRGTSDGQEFSQTYDYTDPVADDQAGVGLLRAGGPLLLTGVILAGVALLAWEHRLWFRLPHAHTVATVAGGLAFVVTLVGLILLPIGIEQNATDDSEGFSIDPSWSAGLYLGVVATTLLLAATVVGTLVCLPGRGPAASRESGAEGAGSGPVDFD